MTTFFNCQLKTATPFGMTEEEAAHILDTVTRLILEFDEYQENPPPQKRVEVVAEAEAVMAEAMTAEPEAKTAEAADVKARMKPKRIWIAAVKAEAAKAKAAEAAEAAAEAAEEAAEAATATKKATATRKATGKAKKMDEGTAGKNRESLHATGENKITDDELDDSENDLLKTSAMGDGAADTVNIPAVEIVKKDKLISKKAAKLVEKVAKQQQDEEKRRSAQNLIQMVTLGKPNVKGKAKSDVSRKDVANVKKTEKATEAADVKPNEVVPKAKVEEADPKANGKARQENLIQMVPLGKPNVKGKANTIWGKGSTTANKQQTGEGVEEKGGGASVSTPTAGKRKAKKQPPEAKEAKEAKEAEEAEAKEAEAKADQQRAALQRAALQQAVEQITRHRAQEKLKSGSAGNTVNRATAKSFVARNESELIQRIPSVFNGKDQVGDFEWEIGKKIDQRGVNDKVTLFVFNDNAQHRILPNRPHSVGVRTRYGGVSYTELTKHIIEVLGKDLGNIHALIKTGKYNKVNYSVGGNGSLGSSILSDQVKRYILNALIRIVNTVNTVNGGPVYKENPKPGMVENTLANLIGTHSDASSSHDNKSVDKIMKKVDELSGGSKESLVRRSAEAQLEDEEENQKEQQKIISEKNLYLRTGPQNTIPLEQQFAVNYGLNEYASSVGANVVNTDPMMDTPEYISTSEEEANRHRREKLNITKKYNERHMRPSSSAPPPRDRSVGR